MSPDDCFSCSDCMSGLIQQSICLRKQICISHSQIVLETKNAVDWPVKIHEKRYICDKAATVEYTNTLETRNPHTECGCRIAQCALKSRLLCLSPAVMPETHVYAMWQ